MRATPSSLLTESQLMAAPDSRGGSATIAPAETAWSMTRARSLSSVMVRLALSMVSNDSSETERM